MKKYLHLLLATLLLLTSFSVPSKVSADGMIMPPGPYPIYESGQKAAIFYQDGVEHMVLSIQFHGEQLEEFGWVVPVPAEPEVEKGDSAIFRELGDMTIPKKSLLEKLMGEDNYYYGAKFGAADALNAEGDRSTVEVIDEKQVGVLDVATLRAGKVQDLIDWMDENGYKFPSKNGEGSEETFRTKQIIQDYIDEDWYFILSKVNPEFVDAELEDTANGHYYDNGYDYYEPNQKVDLTPLRISFETPDIIYPMKISSAGLTNQSILLYVFDDHRLRVSNYDYKRNYGYRNDVEDNSRFSTEYAEKIGKREINNLTRSVGKSSWLDTNKDMYLTKLHCPSLSYTEMEEDVLFEDAKNNKSVNAGEMSLGEWLLVPLVFVIYLPYNILNGFAGFIDYTYWGGGLLSAIILLGFLVGVSAALVIGFTMGMKKVKRDTLKKLFRVLLFPALWLLSACLALVMVIPIGFIMEVAGIREEVILSDVVILLGMISTGLVLLGYKFIDRKKKGI